MRRLRRAPSAILVAVVLVLLFFSVFPTRAIFAQRQRVAVTEEDVGILRDQNRQLELEAARLRSRAEIERRARRQFNMVYPGEQVYRVLPAAGSGPPTTAP
ncbi:MAG: cell division protein FtsL [Actinomycetota bacterium]